MSHHLRCSLAPVLEEWRRYKSDIYTSNQINMYFYRLEALHFLSVLQTVISSSVVRGPRRALLGLSGGWDDGDTDTGGR